MPPTMQESSVASSIEMDTKLSELLSPIRDPTKNWEVNIAATLEDYLSKLEGLHLTFHNGSMSLNFAQAALIIQGSTSVYCKKVEYLCSLCQQMLHIISSERRIPQQTSEVCKEKDNALSSNACDDFCSLDDLKIQKGLDLAEDEHNYSNKRSSTLPLTPVMLIRLEEREKGHTLLLNFKGEVLGNKQDYHLNVCELDDSGALSFPMSSSKFTAESSSSNFSNIPVECDDDNDSVSGADDGISEHRSCSPCPSNFDVPVEKDNFGVPIEKDNSDIHTEKSNFDVPAEEDNFHVPTEENNFDAPVEKDNPHHTEEVSTKSIRKSARQDALKAKRAAAEKQKLESTKISGPAAPEVVKPPRKKVARRLPTKRKIDATKSKGASEKPKSPPTLDLLAGFHCQSFYSNQAKIPSIILKVPPTVDVLDDIFWEATQKNEERLKEQAEKLDESHEKCADGDEAKSSDDDNGGSFPEIDDLMDDAPEMNQRNDNGENVLQPGCSNSEANKEVPVCEELTDNGIESYLSSIAHYCQTNDLSKKVSEWEERIKPILNMESRREAFDIHSYETRVMGNFEDNNKKQTVSFSKICKGKQKWEVCRYFLASLQLANNYNIDISAEDTSDGNDIELTLMSRKKHNENQHD